MDIQIIVRWGIRDGWVLGKPEGKHTYNSAQCSADAISQPTSRGWIGTYCLVEIQKERAEELQAIYWITQAANFNVELDDLLELIYTQLKRVIQLPNFYIALIDQDTGDLITSFLY